MSSDEPVVAVRDLAKTYRIAVGQEHNASLRDVVLARLRQPFHRRAHEDFRALDGVSFDVAEGEVLGLIGPNGAGKSTLLKILARITEPDTGSALIRGRLGSLLEVGTGFHPELTGRENIALNGSVLGMTRREVAAAFDEIVEFADIARFLDTPVKRYSSGMYVRLAFAVAAHLRAEVLIVDEVLAVGDVAFQKKCLGKLSSVAKDQGRTVLFVSHNLPAVQNLCHRCLVLHRGTVIHDGSTDDGVSTYMGLGREAGAEVAVGEWRLDERINGFGDGELHFQALRIKDLAGTPTDSVKTGEGVIIEVDVKDLRHSSREDLVTVAVLNDVDQVLFAVNTTMAPPVTPYGRNPSETLALYLPRLPLIPGQYWIDVAVATGLWGAMIDLAPRAGELNVVASDFHGTGYELSRKDGLMAVEGRWLIVRPGDDPIDHLAEWSARP